MSSILLKIKKLLNLAKCSGANTNEARLAAQRANELMEKHNIEKKDVEQTPSGATGYHMMVVFEARAMKPYQRIVFQCASTLFDLYLFTRTKIQSEQIIMTGNPDECEAAKALGEFFLGEVERLYKVNLPRGLAQHDRAQYRKNFKIQCATELFMRIKEIKNHRPQSTALVCVDKAKKIKGWVDTQLSLTPRRRTRRRYGYGSAEGGMAGKQIKIREEVK